MIIPKKSLLRNPPKLLSPRQVLTFNAMRYSIDICEISLNRLIENLRKFETKIGPNISGFPDIFLDVWSIINNSVIFKNIVCREFELNLSDELFTEINKAKSLRDSNQHIDERLSENIMTNELPVYGLLNWRNETKVENIVNISSIYSGTFTSKKKIEMTISNPKIDRLKGKIHMIEFRGVIRENKNKKRVFREQSIFIDQIISDLRKWIKSFDFEVNEQLKDYDTTEKHISDFSILLKGIKTV